MEISLDRESETPLYQQIQDYLTRLILDGTLAANTRLPATRQLATDLGVNRITVSNAYDELEAAGLVYVQSGRGTYVSSLNPQEHPAEKTGLKNGKTEPGPRVLWQDALAARIHPGADTQWSELLKLAHEPGVISFAGGVPDVETFPVDDFRSAMQTVFKRDGQAAMTYGAAQGYAPLRNAIAVFLREQGIAAEADQILITSGSQQALSLVAMALLQAGDTVIVESPTYANAIQLFQWLRVKVLGVPIDEEGIRVDLLEHLLKNQTAQLIYTIPTFHNPSGTTMSGRRRRALLALAGRYSLPIAEDDYIGGLQYEGPHEPSLKAMDPGGNVIHISTYSKMLMPGPRIGFVLTENPLLERLIDLKHQIDIGASDLIQRTLEAYIGDGRWRAHTRRVSRIYHQRRDAMVAALKEYFPPQAQWGVPKGGFFLWVRLPESISIRDVYQAAIENGVAFAPGPMFFPGEPAYPAFRLSFSQRTEEQIREGIRRLGKVLYEALGREKAVPSGNAQRIEVG
ncbi:MAG: PLP-dependent aminotransferase family protein [Anaerolineaceae bacterium]|nr:PLP-dependent aminotransferase family protein [Anaerolineaceae bacterium]